MKITLETHEWQLLGQLALEISDGQFNKSTMLSAVLLWEFYLENIQQFTQPQNRKKKLKTSTAIGIYLYLAAEKSRDDALWDITLQNLRNKIYQKIHSIKTVEIITIKASAN